MLVKSLNIMFVSHVHGQTCIQLFSLTSTREFQAAKHVSRYIHTRPSRIIHLSTLIANTMAHIKSAATCLLTSPVTTSYIRVRPPNNSTIRLNSI